MRISMKYEKMMNIVCIIQYYMYKILEKVYFGENFYFVKKRKQFYWDDGHVDEFWKNDDWSKIIENLYFWQKDLFLKKLKIR